MKHRLYLETTIPSYLAARPSRDIVIAGHQQITREWWETQRDSFEIYISQLVIDEAAAGDPVAAHGRMHLIQDLPLLDITLDVELLSEAILSSAAFPRQAATDAAHIAVAAVHGMDFLLTWNCAHMANAFLVKAVTDACRRQGLACPTICTPLELLGT